MKKFWAALVCLSMLAPPLDAGKGGSSGGSGSRPSGGSSWGGGSKPSGGGSSWGGGSKPASPSKPSGGGSSWGGGSKPAPASPSKPSGGGSSKPAPAPAEKPRSSWGGGSSSPPKKVVTNKPIEGKEPVSVSKKPAAPTYDKLAITDSKKAESRANYEKATAPAPTYKTPKGESKPIDPKDKQIEYLRGRLDQQKWVNRQQREDQYYSRWSGPAYPPMYYSDPFHPLLNYMMLTMTLDHMAMMVYHHHGYSNGFDDARVRDLYARNAQLEARVRALEAQKVPKDPTWVPPGTDPDLVYDRGFVDAAYNPTPKVVDEYEYDDDGGGYRFWHWVWVIIKWTFYLILAGIVLFALLRFLSYVLFERRYNV